MTISMMDVDLLLSLMQHALLTIDTLSDLPYYIGLINQNLLFTKIAVVSSYHIANLTCLYNLRNCYRFLG